MHTTEQMIQLPCVLSVPCCAQTMASMLNRALARVARPAVRQSSRRMATSVEASVPEAALQPKKTYTAGDKKLMDAKYTEDIGYMFGEKVRLSTPPSPVRLLLPPPTQLRHRGPTLSATGSPLLPVPQPPPEGVARVKQSWETPYVVTMVTAFLMVSVGLTFKPDTTISTWAKTEALRRKKAGEI